MLANTRFRRVQWLFLLLLAALGLLGWRLGEIQIGYHETLARAQQGQNSVEVALEPIPRGRILDRNLFDLTDRQTVFRIVVFPQLIADRDGVAAGLAEVLNLGRQEVRDYLDTPGVLPFPVSRVQEKEIAEKGWSGVRVLPVTLRYGERPLATHTVGHLGPYVPGEESFGTTTGPDHPAGRVVGKTGVERLYDAELRGSVPRALVRVFLDARGRPLPGLGLVVETGPEDDGRHDVRLTLDLRVQQIVEEIMDRDIASGAVVVMDVQTGDILALASRPDYHPLRVAECLESGVAEVFVNQALALFQPGSIFKTVVAAAALEEGLVTPESVFVCAGYEDNLVPCWLGDGHGAITVAQAFAESCNPVFARLAVELGADKLVEYAERFRLNEQALIGFEITPDPRQDFGLIAKPFNLANAGVGQGPVLLNPVQVTALVAAVARDGLWVQPRLVSEIRYGNQAVRVFEPAAPVRIMTRETAGRLAEMMALVTASGHGGQAFVSEWGSAGKTGTAQVGTGDNNCWFSGFVPGRNARYAITVLVRNGVSGGETAAPVFRAIAERIMAAP